MDTTRMIGVSSLALAILFASSPASAQTETEKIRARIKQGQKVSITDDRGQEVRGKIGAITADGVTIVADGKSTDLPYDRILRVDRPYDSLANGALYGLGVGAALGLGLIVSEDQNHCGPEGGFYCGDPTADNYVGATLLFAGLGTAVGVGIDALIHRDREIYRRGGGAVASVAPVIGRGVRGAAVSVTW